MSNDGSGSPVSDVLAAMPWIHGPEDITDDAGDKIAEWGLMGPPNLEAQQVATDKYFGLDRVAPNPHVDHVHIAVPDTFEDYVADVFDSAQHLLLRKHRDYGPKNISDAPGGALNGLRVRMHDKTARINNLIDSGATPENESLKDSFMDLLNYSAIAILVLDGHWPGCE